MPPESNFEALILSWEKTNHAVEAVPTGGLSATALSSLMVAAFFWASVKAFFGFLDFGLAFAFFADFGLALILGFAFDFALGVAFAAVFFGAGFLAALVCEVVGAFLAAVVVLPVCAFGRDTGLVAYVRCDSDNLKLSLKVKPILCCH